MGLKLGKFGAFLGCSNYPTCRNTRPLAVAGGRRRLRKCRGRANLGSIPRQVCRFPCASGLMAPMSSLGPPLHAPPAASKAACRRRQEEEKAKKKDDTPKPKRVSLPKGLDPNLIDLATALKLLGLPREVGPHPETGEMIHGRHRPFRPLYQNGPAIQNLAADDDVLIVGLNRAVVLLAEPSKGGVSAEPRANPAKPLGEHPEDSKPITLNKGRFGPYVKWGKVMATVTKSYDPENLDAQGSARDH